MPERLHELKHMRKDIDDIESLITSKADGRLIPVIGFAQHLAGSSY